MLYCNITEIFYSLYKHDLIKDPYDFLKAQISSRLSKKRDNRKSLHDAATMIHADNAACWQQN